MNTDITLEARILEIIPLGQKSSIRRIDLQKQLGINERIIRNSIESLRHQGYLIGTTGRGYYLCENYKEASAFLDYMRSRVINECWIIRDFKKSAKLRELKAFQETLGI
jgi:biotin operon repressor